MSFFGLKLKGGESAKPSQQGGLFLHLSNACMAQPVDGKKCTISAKVGKEVTTLVTLVGGRVEACRLDLYFDSREVEFINEGTQEVHLCGYYEPDDSMDDSDLSSEEEPQPKKRKTESAILAEKADSNANTAPVEKKDKQAPVEKKDKQAPVEKKADKQAPVEKKDKQAQVEKKDKQAPIEKKAAKEAPVEKKAAKEAPVEKKSAPEGEKKTTTVAPPVVAVRMHAESEESDEEEEEEEEDSEEEVESAALAASKPSKPAGNSVAGNATKPHAAKFSMGEDSEEEEDDEDEAEIDREDSDEGEEEDSDDE